MSLIPIASTSAGVPCANIDTIIALWFRQHLTRPFVGVLWGLTEPGSAACVASIVAVAVIWLVWKRRWFAMATLLLTVGTGSLFSEGLKLVFQRERPFVAGPFGVWGGYSFPSGHTIGATLLYGFLVLALLPYLKRRRWKWLSIGLAAVVILGVGFSRIALRRIMLRMCWGQCCWGLCGLG